jgi:tetratricopeptide (TPR) repeat protein
MTLKFRFAFLVAALTVCLPSLAFGQASSPTPKTPPKSAPAPPPPDAPDHADAYYHYALAHLYEEMVTTYGHPEYATQAIEEYKLALNADPNSHYLNTGLAELYFRLGHVRDAILEAQDILKKDPNNIGAHKLLGRIYLRSLEDMQQSDQSDEMLKLAIAEYVTINKLEANNLEDHLVLGQLYTLDHNLNEAQKQFDAAHAIDPGSEEALLNLARLYTEEGDNKRAVQALESIPADQRTTTEQFALGAAYEETKDYKKAIAAYRAAYTADPDNLKAEQGLAQNLMNDNQLDEAQKVYENITAADPQDAQAYLRISEIQRRKGEYEQALTTLKKAKSLVQDSLEISYNEALLDDALGHFDESAEILNKLVDASAQPNGQYSEADKNNRSLFLDRLANVYREQNRIEDAVAVYRQMIALGGDYAPRGYQFIVDTYRDAKAWPQALAAAQEAVAKLPNNRDMKLMLAGELADSGKVEDAVHMAQSLLNGTPSDRDAEIALEQIYFRQKKWREANSELEKIDAISTRPEEKLMVDFLRGELYDRQKKYEDSEQQFRKVLAAEPENAMALNYLGYSLADRGVRLDEALAMVRKAVELDPQNGAYLDSLGWVYFKMGNYELAEENLRNAITRMPTDPTLHDHLAQVYEKTGRLAFAAAQWEQAMAEYRLSNAGDVDAAEVARVQKHLESARVKLAKKDNEAPPAKQ